MFPLAASLLDYITIFGQNLDSVSSVVFANGVKATFIPERDPQRLRVNIPAGAMVFQAKQVHVLQ